MTVDFDPTDLRFVQDPYPVYRRLRDTAPCHFNQRLGGWLVTGYRDVQTVLRDLPTSDERLRDAVRAAYSPGLVESVQFRIRYLVEQLLDQMDHAGRAELVYDFAYPLAVSAITELMGVPGEDHARVLFWATAMAEFLDQPPPHEAGTEAVLVSMVAATKATAYFRGLLAQSQTRSPEGRVSTLITMSMDTDWLSAQGLDATVVLLLTDELAKIIWHIVNALFVLLSHPDKADELRQDISPVDSAVVELFRYECPVLMGRPRRVSERMELGGRQFEPGELVYPVVAAANRDPSVFVDPGQIDFCRLSGQALPLGFGIHSLGVARIAVDSLLRRFPHLRLDQDAPFPLFRPGLLFRRLRFLPVRCDPG